MGSKSAISVDISISSVLDGALGPVAPSGVPILRNAAFFERVIREFFQFVVGAVDGSEYLDRVSPARFVRSPVRRKLRGPALSLFHFLNFFLFFLRERGSFGHLRNVCGHLRISADRTLAKAVLFASFVRGNVRGILRTRGHCDCLFGRRNGDRDHLRVDPARDHLDNHGGDWRQTRSLRSHRNSAAL
jgi:hypothetical protein